MVELQHDGVLVAVPVGSVEKGGIRAAVGVGLQDGDQASSLEGTSIEGWAHRFEEEAAVGWEPSADEGVDEGHRQVAVDPVGIHVEMAAQVRVGVSSVVGSQVGAVLGELGRGDNGMTTDGIDGVHEAEGFGLPFVVWGRLLHWGMLAGLAFAISNIIGTGRGLRTSLAFGAIDDLPLTMHGLLDAQQSVVSRGSFRSKGTVGSQAGSNHVSGGGSDDGCSAGYSSALSAARGIARNSWHEMVPTPRIMQRLPSNHAVRVSVGPKQ